MRGPVPTLQTTTARPVRCIRLAIAALLAAGGAHSARAQDCPDPAALRLAAEDPAGVAAISADEPIEFEADGLEGTRDGQMLLEGDVVIRQGVRTLHTRDALYDANKRSFRLGEGLEYSDPLLKVAGERGSLDESGAQFEGASFELPAINARGSASRISANAQGELRLSDVRYTTCPADKPDWLLTAADIKIDQNAGLGVGRSVRLDFKGAPILYAPVISFPVGNERKSGFLFPTIGSSSSNGYSLTVPWYWNIAPNMDATFAPAWFSKRGAALDTEFRYLTSSSNGRFQASYLPHDPQLDAERSLVQYRDRTNFTDFMRLDVDAANASDNRWFEDFGMGPEGTSISYLNRSAGLTWLGRHWIAGLRAQNFQVIDNTIEPALRPYTLLPQFALRARYPDQWLGLTAGLELEAANFEHSLETNDKGWRLDAAPELRLPLRGAGMWLEPAASWRYTAYKLENELRPGGDSPSRSAPIMSLDAGMAFERLSGSRNQRLLTLEPRFLYLYVPFREQEDLPVFDTALADLNVVQLFRTNRFVGPDRLGDANQVSVGVTSRLLDADTGRQFIAGTVGQIYYFEPPRVTLPGEPPENPHSSDIVAELGLTAYANWNVSAALLWDPSRTRSEKGDVQVQYKPEYDRVVNLGYRFRRGSIEQVDASTAWPIGRNWSAYARMVYSLKDQTSLDRFAGFEYRSCCWRLRVVGRRYVSTRTGDRDTSVLLQLELTGLSSVGTSAGAFLERAIRGYSFGDTQSQNTY